MKTPADWERVRGLFHRALALRADERAEFLRGETWADEATRKEVESLLAAHPQAEGFLSDSPVHSVGEDDPSTRNGSFHPGTRLGAFEILGPLGAGGMGEVYRARTRGSIATWRSRCSPVISPRVPVVANASSVRHARSRD